MKEEIKSLLIYLKPLLKQKDSCIVNATDFELVCTHTYRDVLTNTESYVGLYNDGRYKKRIVWEYNIRELTKSYSTLLHEMGHIYSDNPSYISNTIPVFGGGKSRCNMDDHELLLGELAAWDWCCDNWKYVPLRTRFPYEYMYNCLDTYYTNNDQYYHGDFCDDVDETLPYYYE